MLVCLLSCSAISSKNEYDPIDSKFWLHRVNSPKRLSLQYNKYKGFELDIIFHTEMNNEGGGTFENSHDSDNSAWYGLEEMFKTLSDLGFAEDDKGIWLDYKNLTEENKTASLSVLETLMSKYGFDRKKFWIESSNWSALKEFRDNGFITSYYFPYCDLSKMAENDKQVAKDKIHEAFNTDSIDAVSFDYCYYDFVSPEVKENQNMLCWNLNNAADVMFSTRYEKCRNDKRIRIILIAETDQFYR